MKKVTNYLLMAALLIGFAACNNEDVPEVDNNEGNTYASLTIGYAPMKSPVAKSTRAVSDSSFEGTEAEKNVTSITLFGEPTAFGETTATTNKLFENPSFKDNLWTVKAWATIAGTRSFGLGLNFATPDVDLTKETNTTGAILGGAITDYVTTGAIAMSSTEVKKQTINNGVSEEQADSAKSTAHNLVHFDVKRVVAKAAVRAGALSFSVTEGNSGPTLGSFSDLSFAPTNLSKETFLFEKDEMDPKMLEETAAAVTNADNYARLGDDGLKDLVKPDTTTAYHPYKAVPMNLTSEALADIEGNYFFENIEKALFWGNITYMKVYGTFTPATDQIQQLNAEGPTLENPDDFTAGTSFSKGAFDGKLYTTLAAAQFAVPGQKAYKYEGGRMGYRVLVYQDPAGADFDTKSTPVTNADVKRNYFYILDITAIQGLGFNYDGNDSNDPNLPKPTGADTDEPVDPEDGVVADTPINSTDTYMRVQATVLPWTVVGRDVVLK